MARLMSTLSREVFVAVQKIRHEVAEAKPGQQTIGGYGFLTVKQAEALLRWIDKQQEKP
jgi:hypothetical protein